MFTILDGGGTTGSCTGLPGRIRTCDGLAPDQVAHQTRQRVEKKGTVRSLCRGSGRCAQDREFSVAISVSESYSHSTGPVRQLSDTHELQPSLRTHCTRGAPGHRSPFTGGLNPLPLICCRRALLSVAGPKQSLQLLSGGMLSPFSEGVGSCLPVAQRERPIGIW